MDNNSIKYSMEVVVRPECAHEGCVDELCSCVPQLVEKWNNALEKCVQNSTSIFEFPAMSISPVNSKNFQVIGMLYKVVHGWQREHGSPELFRIICADDSSAKMYRQIYNFYIPCTKEERMKDNGWD